jgi:hypothetical protein
MGGFLSVLVLIAGEPGTLTDRACLNQQPQAMDEDERGLGTVMILPP